MGSCMEMVRVGLRSLSLLAGNEAADMWRSGSEQGQLLLLPNSAFIALLSSSSSATAIRPLCYVEEGKLNVPTRLARLLPNCFPQQLFDELLKIRISIKHFTFFKLLQGTDVLFDYYLCDIFATYIY